jgi:hypothetical protein
MSQQPKVDYPAVAVMRLQEAVRTGNPSCVYADAGALYGIARQGIRAGQIEALLGQLKHKDRVAIRRAAKATAGAVVEERTRPPVREVPPLPLLVVHGAVWRVLDEDRYLVVQRELSVVELARLHGIDTTVPVGEHGVRELKPGEAYKVHGVTAREIRWTYDAAGPAWDAAERTLEIPGARIRKGTARRSELVEGWLYSLVPEHQIETLLDWLATAVQLDRPTASPQFRGPDSAGKALLVAALTTLLGGRTDYTHATGDFNAGLIFGPLVVLDEGVAESRPDAFRRLTGNREHPVVAKNRMPEELRGCPRVIVTSNEDDPLRLGREELSSQSEHALGRRIIIFDVQTAAVDYLADLGGWAATADWAEPEGELVCHLRWLAQERGPKVTPGQRFLVEGDAGAWVASSHLRRGTGADVLAAYQAYQDDPEVRGRCKGDPFVHDRTTGRVGVSPGALLRCWREILGPQEKVPSSQVLGRALKRLSDQEKPTRGGPEGDRGPRRYWVDPERLPEDTS